MISRRNVCATFALACLLFSSSFSSAYDQSAAQRIEERFRDKWSSIEVLPRWTSPSEFWYQAPQAGGPGKLMHVDAAAGNRLEAEDGDKLPEQTAEPWKPNSRQRHGRPTRTSPDDKWRITVRDHNLWLINRETDEEIQKTTDGVKGHGYDARVYWSPDSTHFVAMHTKGEGDRRVYLVESSPEDQLQPKLDSYHYLKPGDDIALRRPRLFAVGDAPEIEVSNELFDNPWEIGELRWDPESRFFTFYYNQRGHQVARVLKVDAETGEVQTLVDEQQPTFIDYAHKHFAYYLDDTAELIWMSERDGWNHLYLVDMNTGEVKHQITKGEWIVRGVEHVDPQKREILFRAGGIYPEQDPYYVHYCRVGFDGENLVKLTEGDGTHKVQYSPEGDLLIDTYSRVDLPPVTELRRASDGTLAMKLEESDLGALTELGWRPPERFVAKARDGETDIYGVIFRPTDFDPNRLYPVVEDLYAGPQGSFVPKQFYLIHNEQRLAELGFIVVRIDGLGTSNRSKAFHDVCCKNLADAGLPDRRLWMKAAADQYPQLDLTRVGVMGHSAGAQSAMGALLWHGDFYKVAVSSCGCHDNRMDKIWWNELWMGWPIGPHYEEQSNVTNAHRLDGKLFLIVGELDKNVDPASTMQVVDALIKADKDFDMLVVPGRGHNTFTPYVERRKRDFLMEHLDATTPKFLDTGATSLAK
ncbi:DPP IV N-terminal domain-containing protein [Aeoliella sp. ICT_H6.2]|uniref:DPP IV N-terminal domain-containing protein n=1 Tax=Aeoliella straminimaris TaxID=2954799 RepID=A0A9X2FJL1_9BACT|nr:DPP IV N-terminal domain-containing protein [Aeoliella straminimaris]MCO6047401.1 DPP IV N-terminal domain-containing protein [Aeoliella straminimaris]